MNNNKRTASGQQKQFLDCGPVPDEGLNSSYGRNRYTVTPH